MSGFDFFCDHNPGCDQLISVNNIKTPIGTPGDILHIISCVECGCEYNLQISQNGLGLEKIDIATPKITSININQGSIEGNIPIQINGHRLDFNNIVVKFDNVEATNISNQSNNQLTCNTPPGLIILNKIEERTKVFLSSIVGTFLPEEEIVGEITDTTTLIDLVGSDFILVDHISEQLELENIIGQVSGATATIVSINKGFEIDEIVIGEISGVTAIIKEIPTYKVNSLSGLFQAGEWVIGQTSGFRIKLDKTNSMTGYVDITVENDNGLGEQGTLVEGFEYII